MDLLANEILRNILYDSCLSGTDHSSLLQVCKHFKDIIEENRRCSLAVDAISHPMWKFGRHLLSNPAYGEHFTEITLTWQRRNFKGPRPKRVRRRYADTTHKGIRPGTDSPDTTTDWVWTEPEKQQILEICKKWEFTRKTTDLILVGVNSESLLPLILCFTPRLRSLDLGEPETDIIFLPVPYSRYAYKRATEILSRGGRLVRGDSSDDDGYKTPTSDDIFNNPPLASLNYYRLENKFRPKKHSLFFFENLQYKLNDTGEIVGPRKLFPGLASLQYFSMGKEVWSSNAEGLYHIEPWDIYPVLLFPRIKDIHFYANRNDRRSYYGYYKKFLPHTVGPSVLQRLELHTSFFGDAMNEDRKNYLKTISELTGNLERVYIRTWKEDHWQRADVRFQRFEADFREDDKAVLDSFLHHNPSTLKPSNILVNGAGFDETGSFDVQQERKRNIAESQRRFEMLRDRNQALHAKNLPQPIMVLDSDILSRILSYLHRRDKFNLMLSCKALYSPCYRDIWSRFHIISHENDEEDHPDFITVARLARLQYCVSTSEVSGFEHLEHLKFMRHTTNCRYIHPDTLNFLTDHLQAGGMPNLKDLEVQLARYKVYEAYWPANIRILAALKEYSEKKSPEDFSLRLDIYLYSGQHLSRLFDLKNLKSLTAGLTYDYCHNVPYATDFVSFASTLIEVISGSPNLETLSLRGSNLKLESSEEVKKLWERLEALQETVADLQKLRSLTISHEVLFHPSFLLVPPVCCKSVSYEPPRLSPAWWQKFAKEPFVGVERMTLECLRMDGQQIGEMLSQGSDEERGVSRTNNLELSNIEVSGLIQFRIKRTFNGRRKCRVKKAGSSKASLYDYPMSLPELILKKNKQLQKESLQELANIIVNELKHKVGLSGAQEKAVELEAWLKDHGICLTSGRNLDCESEGEEEEVEIEDEDLNSSLSDTSNSSEYNSD